MPSPINEHKLRHLAELARLKLEAHEEEKLLHDLHNILDHFAELEAVDTSQVEPMKGGTKLVNVFREDTTVPNAGHGEPNPINAGRGRDAFPETERDYLKVPPIFHT